MNSGRVTASVKAVVTAKLLGIRISEPVQVISVITEPFRVGFSYRTLPKHPVHGEEAFIVHRDHDGTVSLTVRSLTSRASEQPWRALYPLLLLAQIVVRRRYLRALR